MDRFFRNFILPILIIGIIPLNTLAIDQFEMLEKELDAIYGEVPEKKDLDEVIVEPVKKHSGKRKVKDRRRTRRQAPKSNIEARIKATEAQLKKKPTNLNLKQKLAYLYLKAGRVDDCIKVLRQDSDRLNRRGLMTIARAHDLKGNLKEVIRILNVYVNAGRGDHIIFTILGDANRRRGGGGGLDAAVLNFKAAIKYKNNYLPAWMGLVQTFKDSNNSYELIIVYNDMINTLGPTDLALNELCQLYAEGGFIDKAKTYCQEAIQRVPRKPENHIYLGQSLVDGGNLMQGRKIIKQAAKQFPKSELAQWKAGDISEAEANFAGASRFYERGTKADPKSARSFLGMARTKFELQDYEAAYKAFYTACKLDKTKTHNFKSAGRQLRNEGQTKLAAKYQSGLGTCLLKKPMVHTTEEPEGPVFVEID